MSEPSLPKNLGSSRDRAASPEPSAAPTDRRDRPGFELSATQILAGTGAAATAALLGSSLGVAGTIVGAAVGSLVSIVTAAVYTHTLATARYRVRTAVRNPGQPPNRHHSPDLADEPRRSWPRNPRPAPRQPDRLRPGVNVRRRSLLLGVVAASIVFVTTIGLVTGIETVTGQPLSGGPAGGLTVLGGDRSGTPDVEQDVELDTTPTDPSGSTDSSDADADRTASSAAPTDGSTGKSTDPSPGSTEESTDLDVGSTGAGAGADQAPPSPAVDGATSAPSTSGPPEPATAGGTSGGGTTTPTGSTPTADPTGDPTGNPTAASPTTRATTAPTSSSDDGSPPTAEAADPAGQTSVRRASVAPAQ